MTAEAVIASRQRKAGNSFLPATSPRQLIWLNLTISLALAFGIWATQKRTSHTLANEIFQSLIHGAVYGSVFGLGLSWVSERLALLRRPWNVISIMSAIVLVAALGTFLIQCLLFLLSYLRSADFWPEFAYKTVVVVILASLIGWGVQLYESVQTRLDVTHSRLTAEKFEKERALKLAREAQLASLESKLHPHFLFNTLNSISALISEEPALADKIVLQLSRVLRSSLDALNQSSVPLEEELKLVVDYLEIEKARFGERLRYSLEVQPEVAALHVPPLILLPLIENSVKFAVFPRSGGGTIAISAHHHLDRLVMAVRDDGPGFTADAIADGHGLDTLRQRLKTLFQDSASLTISNGAEETIVAVSIALRSPHWSP
jgi:sensor histidine kinase YesM